jgi:hypothetical protein
MKLRFLSVILMIVMASTGATAPGASAARMPASAAAPHAFSCADVTEIPLVECSALVSLYSTTNGSNWNSPSGWLVTNTPCSDWHGVTCSGGHVTELRLGSNNLVGPIHQDIRYLTQLTVLDLGYNKLTGWIPIVLGELTHLTTLFLGYNSGLTWMIPWQLGNLTNLRELSLTGCSLFGPIPATFASLTELRTLDLSFNYLSGWALVVGALPHLSELSLRNNPQLRGALPSELVSHMPVADTTILHYDETGLCEPSEPDFQAFLTALETVGADVRRSSETCDAIAAAVSLSQNAHDLVGTWSHAEPNTAYDVHRSAIPYFVPSDATKRATLPPAPTGVYTDTSVLAAPGNNFYVVRSRFNAASADSNQTAEFTYKLVR